MTKTNINPKDELIAHIQWKSDCWRNCANLFNDAIKLNDTDKLANAVNFFYQLKEMFPFEETT